MKIRSGFVSNSSSSSFVLFGLSLQESDYESLCRELIPEKDLKKALKEYEDEQDNIEWGEIWYDNSDKTDLDVISCGYSGDMWVGKTLASGGDGELETGSISLKEMNEISEEIQKKFPGKECEIHYGTYGC